MDPSTAALEVAKLIPVAKSAFDHLKTRMKTAEDIPKLIDLYDAFQTLRDENMRLREELRQRDARAAYTRKKMGVAVAMYASKWNQMAPPGHLAARNATTTTVNRFPYRVAPVR